MDERLTELIARLVDSSPYIAAPIILTILWRKEILAFLFKLRPEDEIGRTIETMATKQDRMIEKLDEILKNSAEMAKAVAVVSALVNKL